MTGKNKIPSYELYCVFGQSPYFREMFGKVYPSKFQPMHVKAYLQAKKNKVGPFKQRKVVAQETIDFLP